MSNQEPELLPCPMCGGKADYNWDEIGEEKIRQWYIHCAPDDSFKGCVAHDGRFATLREAVTHWNTRASLPSAQPSDVVECKVCDDLLDTLAVLPPSTAAQCKRGLERAMELLKPFDDDGLSLGLGKNALDPIKDALDALTTQQAQSGDVQELTEANDNLRQRIGVAYVGMRRAKLAIMNGKYHDALDVLGKADSFASGETSIDPFTPMKDMNFECGIFCAKEHPNND